MHIAYSATHQTNKVRPANAAARYKGYQAACRKHADTLADIRRYMPDWMPDQVGEKSRLAVVSDQ